MNLDNFCQGAVQGVFTTLGWVFFAVKILVPILLIVFGSINFGKAVISSKDDEIKKAGKSLVIKAIAGILIFFVPSFLNLIVDMVDHDNVYNGDFADCTRCMFNPSNNCASLGGK